MRMLGFFVVCVGCFLGGGCANTAWRHVDVEPLREGSRVVASEFRYGRTYIFVSINGHEPEKFLFDTGTPVHSITPQAAQRLGITASLSVDVNDAYDHMIHLPTGVADTVEFGPVTLRNATFVLDENARNDKINRVGTIGINGLGKFTIDLDYPKDTLSITDERLDSESPNTMRYISRKYAKVYFPLRVQAERKATQSSLVWTLLDTGNNGGLLLDRRWSKKLSDINNAYPLGEAVGSHGIPWDISLAPIKGSVVLGEVTIEGTHVVVDQPESNAGVALYEDFHVKIDGVSKLISFERPDGAQRVVWVMHLGMFPLWKRTNGYHLGYLIPGGIAQSTGMVSGDLVVSINGQAPTESLHRSAYWPISADATSVTIRILRDGEEIKTVLPLDGSIDGIEERARINPKKPRIKVKMTGEDGEVIEGVMTPIENEGTQEQAAP